MTGALRAERGWRLLAGPAALLLWFRTRRMRKQAAAGLELAQALMRNRP